jgi:hypothetical protein
MKGIFSHMVFNYSEYQYWLTLPDSEKLIYLFDAFSAVSQQTKITKLDLSEFFNSIKPELENNSMDDQIEDLFERDDIDRVDVMIDDQNIMIESNSLKALRFVTYKFIESGYILRRDISIEKMFRKDKVTRYLRVFKIINQAPDLCFN